MTRRLAAITAVAAACALTFAAPAVAAPARPGDLTLRLADVGRGYVIGDDPGLTLAIAGEGATRALTEIYLQHPHAGSVAELTELWAPPGSARRPDHVSSAAFVFDDAAGPAAEMQHARDVAAYVFGVLPGSMTPLPAPSPLGDETLAFATSEASVLGKPRRDGVVVLWRSDKVMALLHVASLRGEIDTQVAAQLAALQQQRIATPTPLAPDDNDDLEVLLDDPRLDLAVPWLGRDFDPRGRLPSLALYLAEGAPPELGRIRLEYGTQPFSADIALYIWPRSAWRRNARTRFGRLVWHERCVRTTRVPIAGGVAVLYAGYVHRPVRCGRRAPDRFLAHVFLRDVVVSVNPMIGWTGRGWGGRYDSAAGMRTVVRALRLRNVSTP